jgi:hypothetical protein
MIRNLFFGSIAVMLSIAAIIAFAQDSTQTFKAETFFFKTTGTLKPLLSASAYQAVVSAAKASGYSEEEIEVTIIVTERKKNFEERRQNNSYTPYAPKPKPKKFE